MLYIDSFQVLQDERVKGRATNVPFLDIIRFVFLLLGRSTVTFFSSTLPRNHVVTAATHMI